MEKKNQKGQKRLFQYLDTNKDLFYQSGPYLIRTGLKTKKEICSSKYPESNQTQQQNQINQIQLENKAV